MSIERKILKVLTHSVVRLVFPSGQIVKRVMPGPNSEVREDIDVKDKDLTLAITLANIKGKDLTLAMTLATDSVARPVCPSGQIVKSVMPNSTSAALSARRQNPDSGLTPATDPGPLISNILSNDVV